VIPPKAASTYVLLVASTIRVDIRVWSEQVHAKDLQKRNGGVSSTPKERESHYQNNPGVSTNLVGQALLELSANSRIGKRSKCRGSGDGRNENGGDLHGGKRKQRAENAFVAFASHQVEVLSVSFISGLP
jgi:hypothetical protein